MHLTTVLKLLLSHLKPEKYAHLQSKPTGQTILSRMSMVFELAPARNVMTGALTQRFHYLKFLYTSDFCYFW